MKITICYRYMVSKTQTVFLTIGDAVIEAISDAIRIPPVLSFEFVFAGFPITARQDVRNKLIVLAKLGKCLSMSR